MGLRGGLSTINNRGTRFAFNALAAMLIGLAGCGGEVNTDPDSFSPSVFANPPPEFGPMIRWWWPGGAVDERTALAHLEELRALGYSGVEIQPTVLGMTQSELEMNPAIATAGEPEFLSKLGDISCVAASLGLSVDITLGSSWPNGSPAIDAEASRQLLVEELALSGPMNFDGDLPEPTEPAWVENTNLIVPVVGPFDGSWSLTAVVAAEVIDSDAEPPLLEEGQDITSFVDAGRLSWAVPAGTHRVFAIYENRTSHNVLGGAYPGALEDAKVIDHLDRAGIDAMLAEVGQPWLDSMERCPPTAFFVDSFEFASNLPWTTDFEQRFEELRGYDPTPFLPFVFLDTGESEYAQVLLGPGMPMYQLDSQRGARAREDYEAVRATLFQQEYFGPLREWSQANGVQLRVQAYGGYGNTLDDLGLVDIPESEDLFAGGIHDFHRLIASAAHTGGKRIVSIESLAQLGSTTITRDEAWRLTAKAFAAGINRPVHHGAAYPYTRSDGVRWYPFANNEGPVAAALNFSLDIHPDAEAWGWLPAVNRTIARLSYAMSRGEHVAEVAWLYSERGFDNGLFGQDESPISVEIRSAGYSYDMISPSALEESGAEAGKLTVGSATYEALVVEGFEASDATVLEAIDRAVANAVPVVWLGQFPERAVGLSQADERDLEVAGLASALSAEVTHVSAASGIPEALEQAGVAPALGLTREPGGTISVHHRRVEGGHLFFLFNDGDDVFSSGLTFNFPFGAISTLDVDTGQGHSLSAADGLVDSDLAPNGAVVLWVQNPR